MELTNITVVSFLISKVPVVPRTIQAHSEIKENEGGSFGGEMKTSKSWVPSA